MEILGEALHGKSRGFFSQASWGCANSLMMVEMFKRPWSFTGVLYGGQDTKGSRWEITWKPPSPTNDTVDGSEIRLTTSWYCKYPIIRRVSVACQVVSTGLVDPSTVGVGCTPAPKNHHGFFFAVKPMSLVENLNVFLFLFGGWSKAKNAVHKVVTKSFGAWELSLQFQLVMFMICLSTKWVANFIFVGYSNVLNQGMAFPLTSSFRHVWAQWLRLPSAPRSISTKNFTQIKMDVSENRGTPKSSILKGFSIINHPFSNTPIFGNTQMFWKKRLVYSRWWQLKYFWNFHPDPCGKWSKFDEHMFQMGWFNHQLVGAKCYLWGFASTLLFWWRDLMYIWLPMACLHSPEATTKNNQDFMFCSFFGGQPLQEKMSVPYTCWKEPLSRKGSQRVGRTFLPRGWGPVQQQLNVLSS